MKITIERFLILVLVVLLIFTNFKSCQRNQQINNLYDSTQDSLRSYIDKNGKQVSVISVLLGRKNKDLYRIRTKDSTIIDLQKQVKAYRGKLQVAINLKNKTRDTGITSAEVDTVVINGVVYSTYSTRWKNKWGEGLIVARKDSIFRDIVFFNDFEINIGKVKNDWFKKPVTEISIKNLNPNTLTTDIRTFKVSNNQKRIALGLNVGYGVNSSGVSPYFGIGLNYNLIYIK